MMARSWSIQRLFSLFLLAALLPQLLRGAYGISTEFVTETERAEINLNVLAQLTAAHTRQFITDTEQLLARLAERDAIRAVNSTRCDPILAEFHRASIVRHDTRMSGNLDQAVEEARS
jgi:hypothetical protein